MSVAGFQRALCDLIASPELCVRLRRRETSLLDRYELTGRERRRLEAVVGQPGMSVNCTLYRVNRITPLYSLLPRSCTLLGDRLSGEASAFWAAESTDLQFGPEIERFASFLKERMDEGEIEDPFLRDVLDFELAVHALRFAPRSRHSLRVVRFGHDPLPLLETLTEHAPPPRDLPNGDFYLLVDATGPELQVRPLDT